MLEDNCFDVVVGYLRMTKCSSQSMEKISIDVDTVT